MSEKKLPVMKTPKAVKKAPIKPASKVSPDELTPAQLASIKLGLEALSKVGTYEVSVFDKIANIESESGSKPNSKKVLKNPGFTTTPIPKAPSPPAADPSYFNDMVNAFKIPHATAQNSTTTGPFVAQTGTVTGMVVGATAHHWAPKPSNFSTMYGSELSQKPPVQSGAVDGSQIKVAFYQEENKQLALNNDHLKQKVHEAQVELKLKTDALITATADLAAFKSSVGENPVSVEEAIAGLGSLFNRIRKARATLLELRLAQAAKEDEAMVPWATLPKGFDASYGCQQCYTVASFSNVGSKLIPIEHPKNGHGWQCGKCKGIWKNPNPGKASIKKQAFSRISAVQTLVSELGFELDVAIYTVDMAGPSRVLDFAKQVPIPSQDSAELAALETWLANEKNDLNNPALVKDIEDALKEPIQEHVTPASLDGWVVGKGAGYPPTWQIEGKGHDGKTVTATVQKPNTIGTSTWLKAMENLVIDDTPSSTATPSGFTVSHDGTGWLVGNSEKGPSYPVTVAGSLVEAIEYMTDKTAAALSVPKDLLLAATHSKYQKIDAAAITGLVKSLPATTQKKDLIDTDAVSAAIKPLTVEAQAAKLPPIIDVKSVGEVYADADLIEAAATSLSELLDDDFTHTSDYNPLDEIPQ